MRYISKYRKFRRPTRRTLTDSQLAANRKRFAECAHTIHGRFARGQLVVDYDDGRVWRVVTYGICYHEDVASCIYGVKPARAPREYTATRTLREAIGRVCSTGTQEPGSRAGDESQRPRPDTGAKIAEWRDGRPDSLASFPYVQIYPGGVIRAVRPIYDDSPIVAWVRDEVLTAKLVAAIKISPDPYHIPDTEVSGRPVANPEEGS